MEAPPVLFHSPLYRSFIIVLGKLLYEYRPNPDGCRYYALFSFLPNVTVLSKNESYVKISTLPLTVLIQSAII